MRVRVDASLRMRVAGQSGHRIKGLLAKNLHIYNILEKNLPFFLSMEKDCIWDMFYFLHFQLIFHNFLPKN